MQMHFEAVVSKMHSVETRNKCRVAGGEQRCERRRRIQKEGGYAGGNE